MAVAPKPNRFKRYRLKFLPESAACWDWIARFVRGQIRAENVWRQRNGIGFCHMPISQADYLAEPIDRGRVYGNLDKFES